MERVTEIYFLRHGPAGSRAAWAPKPDRDRPLTPSGKRRTKKVAKALRRLNLSFDRIMTSPHARAFETARMVAKALDGMKKLEILSGLTPTASPAAFIRRLSAKLRSEKAILIVGHEPFLSETISLLCQGKGAFHLSLKKAGLCRVDLLHRRPPQGTLVWLLPPSLLRQS